MNKNESLLIKGIAILMMLFLHLFNSERYIGQCTSLLYIGDTPLAYILTRAASPVAFFLIIGGYGLYITNRKVDKNRWNRLLKLFIHYWITLLIFVSIGHCIKPDLYPGNALKVIENITAYHTTYNPETWFLLPYIGLSILAPWLFRIMNRFQASHVVIATLFLHLCTSFCISRYGASFLYQNMWLYNALLIPHLLFDFSLGAMAARCGFFEKLKQHSLRYRHASAATIGGVILLISTCCLFKYNFFHAFLMISCILLLRMPKVITHLLEHLGKHSMNMWMVHTWLSAYLFHDFIYSFKYPVLIFLVLVIVSYACSHCVNFMARPVVRALCSR